MISDRIKTVGVVVSMVIAIGAVVFASVGKRDSKVKSGILLVETVSSNTLRHNKNDGKWDNHKDKDEDHRKEQAIRDKGQDDEIEAVQSTHKALLDSNTRNEQGNRDLNRKMEDGFKDVHKFQLEQVKAMGELSGHIKSITELTETR